MSFIEWIHTHSYPAQYLLVGLMFCRQRSSPLLCSNGDPLSAFNTILRICPDLYFKYAIMHQSGAPSWRVAVTAASVSIIEVLIITIVQRARTFIPVIPLCFPQFMRNPRTGMHSAMSSRRLVFSALAIELRLCISVLGRPPPFTPAADHRLRR
ncbi:hypothetical protein K503DRAFT_116757 [Rhizopogon vinicolor AM-OR11-026]|uniref:Uncharacterized protein n=1 Tax=Rhizopogon vinicolor AM-OR11-026 TaxID=1314800 RepID=A0A1B7MEW5_9AGAM|nr:hypothetical protein K503DRAFT_116757 [Rhizopogon vinicolor AM-OR11-026]